MKKIIVIVTFLHFLLLYGDLIFFKNFSENIPIIKKSNLTVKIGAKVPHVQIVNNNNKKENKLNSVQKDSKKIEKKKKIKKKIVKKKSKVLKKQILEKETFEKDTLKTDTSKEKNKEEAVSSNLPANIKRVESGGLVASSSEGIKYTIKKEVFPEYPQKAKSLRIRKEISIKIRFLVGSSGLVKKVLFLTKRSGLGFEEQVEIAMKKWRFEPILYKGNSIEVYFQKEFKFKIK